MLPKKRRLNRAAFDSAYRGGVSRHGALLSARISPAEGVARVSAVVSKKVAKTSVARNTLRRRLYSLLENVKGTHLIVFAKKGAEKASRQALKDDLARLLGGRGGI